MPYTHTHTRTTPVLSTLLMMLITLHAACLGTSLGQNCVFDSECGPSQRCVQSICYQECTSDDQCAQDEEESCQSQDRGGDGAQDIAVCIQDNDIIATETNHETSCTENSECQERLNDERARCGILSTCIIPPEEHTIIVEDLSTRGQPGAEILTAYLEDQQGTLLDTLTIQAYTPVEPLTSEGAQDFAWLSPHHMTCNTTSTALALGGQSGELELAYLNAQGRKSTLEEGWSIVVHEKGSQCDESEPNDPLQIMLCVTLTGDPFTKDRCRVLDTTLQEGMIIAPVAFNQSLRF